MGKKLLLNIIILKTMAIYSRCKTFTTIKLSCGDNEVNILIISAEFHIYLSKYCTIEFEKNEIMFVKRDIMKNINVCVNISLHIYLFTWKITSSHFKILKTIRNVKLLRSFN